MRIAKSGLAPYGGYLELFVPIGPNQTEALLLALCDGITFLHVSLSSISFFVVGRGNDAPSIYVKLLLIALVAFAGWLSVGFLHLMGKIYAMTL